ncbi:RagB/SusD family nutrient uptake outer membrane protein [Dinghuibacter silviterrae]|uniref:Putative outer membrane starch-binding protein n=1 Tax=Dinghuibacter silviterrae TaxID=1539049 RepID=A0A4R8DHV4_9BACT|nr:RagB/SusD family nutrient uptake outer membrane protein [Dinghuibacter silviterrae]TDW97048.1 putative outer membrane starch-binding protein [Dinghuibacter silviterrae]
MKKITLYILAAFVLGACQKVGVAVTTELTPQVFPQNNQQFIEASGPPYAALRGNFSLDYWFMQTLSTDEAILPARGGNWYDPSNGYNNLHYHNWGPANGWTNSCWSWLSTVIGATNQALSILGTTEPDSLSYKKSNLAELKIVRDMAYFFQMDLYGNIPLDTTYGDFTPKVNTPRAQVFAWLEGDIKAQLPYLSTAAGTLMYGRANKYTAYALLAKMYLNAEYYTGTARYNDCVAACDSIIDAGNGVQYALQPRSTYLQMFYPTNGPTTQTEFIFAIPYDPSAIAYPGTNGFMYHARYDLDRTLGIKYGYAGGTPGSVVDPIVGQAYPGTGLIATSPSGPESTLPSFYAYFSDTNDIRNGQWLTGLQYNKDGTPLMVKTTKGGAQGYDATYTGTDAGATYYYQLNLTPDVYFRTNPASGANPALFDLGNDHIAWNMGYRNIKFLADYTNPSNRNQNNDVPVFRYADVLLEKAEAILRGATPTQGQTALSLVNAVRAARTTSAAWGSLTLDSVYNERCREMTWETWHRNDMIRFGKYEGAWGFKTDADPNHRIYPIPNTALLLDPALTQNPGY